MKYDDLKKDFGEQVFSALKEFVVSENNKAVYAIAFDCDLDVGQIVLRYSNSAVFEKMKESWDDYKYMYKPYGQNGLYGLKYNSVGDYEILKYDFNGFTRNFLDSYYYYSVGEYYGESEPISEFEMNGELMEKVFFKASIEKIFTQLVIETITEVKKMTEIDFTEDSLVFMCGHDISNREFRSWVSKINDKKLVDRLAKIKD